MCSLSVATYREETACAANGGPRADPVPDNRAFALLEEKCMARRSAVLRLLKSE